MASETRPTFYSGLLVDKMALPSFVIETAKDIYTNVGMGDCLIFLNNEFKDKPIRLNATYYNGILREIIKQDLTNSFIIQAIFNRIRDHTVYLAYYPEAKIILKDKLIKKEYSLEEISTILGLT